jgi:chemotaxis protein CheZ
MMAQDFHDLTGQVVAKVVPWPPTSKTAWSSCWCRRCRPSSAPKVEPTILQGPVVDAEGRTDVVTNQGEVDDLLASLGF